MGGRREVFELLAVENVECNQMNFSMTVFAGLGGRHVNDLAGTALDHDMSVLAQSRTLHGKGGRGASIGGLEGDFMLLEQGRAHISGYGKLSRWRIGKTLRRVYRGGGMAGHCLNLRRLQRPW